MATQDFPTDPILYAERRRGRKRHRVHDEDLRNEIVKRATRGQATVGSVMRAVGLVGPGKRGADWQVKHLQAYCAAGWRCWQDCVVVSISADASKFGQPAEETMSYVATDGWRSAWLPPQVADMAPDTLGQHVPLVCWPTRTSYGGFCPKMRILTPADFQRTSQNATKPFSAPLI